MLLYNFQKEFLGIDKSDLEALGLSTLATLQEESADFADLFIKTPGYIHNFKHIHWIDFITCGNSNDDPKVIIHINNKNYKAIIDIKTIYLVDNPAQEAYQINLNHLRELSPEENRSITEDIAQKSAPKISVDSKPIIKTSNPKTPPKTHNNLDNHTSSKVIPDPYELKINEKPNDELNTNFIEDVYESNSFDAKEETLGIDMPDDITNSEATEHIEDISPQETQNASTQKVTSSELQTEDDDYVFDPKVASDELGLPIDLIEEFIQDFIHQAKDFREKLYQAVDEANLDNIKILSHKLKGVAANLRVENAYQILTTMNTSNDYSKIKLNLDKFYKIIAVLANEDPNSLKNPLEEELEITFKDEEIPQKIDIAELADDDFLDIKEEDLSIINDIGLSMDKDIEEDLQSEKESVEILATDAKKIKYNKNTIANEIGIDIDDFNNLFNDFINESKALCNSINKSINNNEPEAWKRSAIKFKGMSDNMRIYEFSPDLNSLIHTKDAQMAKKSLNKIATKLKQISNMESQI